MSRCRERARSELTQVASVTSCRLPSASIDTHSCHFVKLCTHRSIGGPNLNRNTNQIDTPNHSFESFVRSFVRSFLLSLLLCWRTNYQYTHPHGTGERFTGAWPRPHPSCPACRRSRPAPGDQMCIVSCESTGVGPRRFTNEPNPIDKGCVGSCESTGGRPTRVTNGPNPIEEGAQAPIHRTRTRHTIPETHRFYRHEF